MYKNIRRLIFPAFVLYSFRTNNLLLLFENKLIIINFLSVYPVKYKDNCNKIKKHSTVYSIIINVYLSIWLNYYQTITNYNDNYVINNPF